VRRVSRAEPVVHIVVVRPGGAGSPEKSGTVKALKRLGSRVELAIARDAAGCVALCAASEIDLVVVEHALGVECERILTALKGSGPPVIVVCSDAGDEVALEMFRCGAADCVTPRDGDAEALAIVALEQIRRFRAAREKGAADRRIRDLEQYTENIIQNMNSALLVVNLEGRITFSNPPAGVILGEEPDVLRGQLVWRWFDGDEAESTLARTLGDGASLRGAERIITRADGSSVPIGISCSPFLDSARRRIGAVAIFQDLSEVKQLQSQVLQAEKLASIGQLAAGVAHEINNPMGFIHANLSQMSEYVGDLRRVWEQVDALFEVAEAGNPDALRKAAQQVRDLAQEVEVAYLISDLGKAIRESQEGSERIRHIVQDLREFSHKETGELVLANINQCLDSTATIVWPMMKQVVRLEKDYAELAAIPCFPMQIKQVFMNLLVNAYQSIESVVGESGEMGTILLRTCHRDDGIVIEVSDTGMGIPRSHIDRIFDPFFTTKKVGSGTGLGLSTSFGIVKRHGGSMTVASEPGRMTTFSVFLPANASGGDAGGD
jgi:PAS domain S-box-containing protein